MDLEFLKYKFQDGYEGVITKTKCKAGVRHVQVAYMVLCAAAMGSLRASSGIALIAITDASRRNISHIQIQEWGTGVQGAVMWSFLCGHALALLPAELYLAHLGDKFVVTAVLLINGSLTAAMPTIVNRGGWAALCNAYFLMGMTQPCLAPVYRTLLDNWLPPRERQTAACFIHTGSYMGMIVGLPASGWLNGSRLGWELIGYAQATLALSLAVLWALLTAGSPEQHRACPDAEKDYIKETSAGFRKKKLCVPWRSMLQNRRVAALALVHAANNAVFLFYLVDIPLYLKSTGLTLQQCGLQSMIPFIVLFTLCATTGPTVGCLLNSNLLAHVFNVTYTRKVISALATISIVSGLAVVPNVPAEWAYLRLYVLIAPLGLLAFRYSGFVADVHELSENYCGTLVVITSAFASLVGAAVPLLTGMILRNQENAGGAWRVVFICMAVFYGVSSVASGAVAASDGGGGARWHHAVESSGMGGHNYVYHNTGLNAEDATQLELLDIKAGYTDKIIERRPNETIA